MANVLGLSNKVILTGVLFSSLAYAEAEQKQAADMSDP